MTTTTTQLTDSEARAIYCLSLFHIEAGGSYEVKRMKEAWPHDSSVERINRTLPRLAAKGLATEQHGYPGKTYRLSPDIYDAYQQWYRVGGWKIVDRWD